MLVTGGAGFVGSNLARRLIAEGARVTILDDFFTGKLSNLAGLDGRYTMVRGTVTDLETVMNLVAQAKIVFHLAARNIIASTRNPLEDFQTNIGGTLNILMAARDRQIERVVYTSSVSVYGNPKYLPINEDDRISLLTPYAVSKYGGEGYCQAFYESYDLPVAVVRYSNVYGPWQDPANPYCGVIAKFIDKVKAGLAPEIHGDGQQTRDFTFVDDAVEATLIAALSPKAEGEVINIGTGNRDQYQFPGKPRIASLRTGLRAGAHRPPRYRQHSTQGSQHRENQTLAALDAIDHFERWIRQN